MSKLLSDDRDALRMRPADATVSGLSKAFGLPTATILASIAEAMGLPVGERVTIAAADAVSNEELLRVLAQRLRRDEKVGDGDAAPTSALTSAPERPTLHVVPDPEPAPMAARPGTPDQPRSNDRGEESQDHGGDDPV